MSFKDMVREDLKNVFFNQDEFGCTVKIKGSSYSAIFYDKGAKEDGYIITEPYFLMQKNDLANFKEGDLLMYIDKSDPKIKEQLQNGKTEQELQTQYHITEIDPIDDLTIKVYVSKDSRTNY